MSLTSIIHLHLPGRLLDRCFEWDPNTKTGMLFAVAFQYIASSSREMAQQFTRNGRHVDRSRRRHLLLRLSNIEVEAIQHAADHEGVNLDHFIAAALSWTLLKQPNRTERAYDDSFSHDERIAQVLLQHTCVPWARDKHLAEIQALDMASPECYVEI